MIRINLLPADLRRGTRLPAKVLAVAVGSALVMLTSVYIFDACKGQTNLDPARAS